MSRIEEMAIAWWKSKHPTEWTVEMHVQNPTVNCTTAPEYRLAKEVGALVKEIRKHEVSMGRTPAE